VLPTTAIVSALKKWKVSGTSYWWALVERPEDLADCSNKALQSAGYQKQSGRDWHNLRGGRVNSKYLRFRRKEILLFWRWFKSKSQKSRTAAKTSKSWSERSRGHSQVKTPAIITDVVATATRHWRIWVHCCSYECEVGNDELSLTTFWCKLKVISKIWQWNSWHSSHYWWS